MIMPISEVLYKISHYDDTMAIVAALESLKDLDEDKKAEAIQDAITNLVGMRDLLKSARHHLAVKSLDSN